MNKIIFPLKLQMKRPEVGNLHEALARIGYQIEAAEKANQHFGASTRQAVLNFQKKYRLESTGGVDERTAQALNAALEELGAFNTELVTFQVKGKVSSTVATGLGGLQVRIMDKTVGEDSQLTAVVTDDEGAYEATFTDTGLRQRGKMRKEHKPCNKLIDPR